MIRAEVKRAQTTKNSNALEKSSYAIVCNRKNTKSSLEKAKKVLINKR